MGLGPTTSKVVKTVNFHVFKILNRISCRFNPISMQNSPLLTIEAMATKGPSSQNNHPILYPVLKGPIMRHISDHIWQTLKWV